MEEKISRKKRKGNENTREKVEGRGRMEREERKREN